MRRGVPVSCSCPPEAGSCGPRPKKPQADTGRGARRAIDRCAGIDVGQGRGGGLRPCARPGREALPAHPVVRHHYAVRGVLEVAHNLLEDDFEVLLVNAAHVKHE